MVYLLLQGYCGVAASTLGEGGERENIKCQVQSMVCSCFKYVVGIMSITVVFCNVFKT